MLDFGGNAGAGASSDNGLSVIVLSEIASGSFLSIFGGIGGGDSTIAAAFS